MLIGVLLPTSVSALYKSDQDTWGTSTIVQTQYLYYNKSTCLGGATSYQMYKTNFKWDRYDGQFSIKPSTTGGTWGYIAINCSTGRGDMASRTISSVASLSYGTWYGVSYSWPYVTPDNLGNGIGANYHGDLYRGVYKKTTLCTSTYLAGGPAC